MNALAKVEIRGEFIRFVVVDGQSSGSKLLFRFLLVLNHRLVKGRVRDSLRKDSLIQIELLLDVLILVRLPEPREEVALHEGLIFAGDLLRRDAVNAVGIVSDSDEEGSQQNAHIEAVSLLPAGYVGGTGYAPGKLIRRVQFLILYELAEPLCALLVVIEFQEAEFGRADSGAYKLIDLALVLGV